MVNLFVCRSVVLVTINVNVSTLKFKYAYSDSGLRIERIIMNIDKLSLKPPPLGHRLGTRHSVSVFFILDFTPIVPHDLV